jgi:hypothetical protein
MARQQTRPAAAASGEVSRPQQKILDIVATLERLGLAASQRASVGAFSGYSYTSGSFQSLLGSMRTLSLIAYPGPGLVVATDLLFPAGLAPTTTREAAR